VTVDGGPAPAPTRITVRDTGDGFDLDRVPHDRLGIRASIFARVAAVGGTSDIQSDRTGTTVRLEWRAGGT
jgi:signal transduction histidine kinase